VWRRHRFCCRGARAQSSRQAGRHQGCAPAQGTRGGCGSCWGLSVGSRSHPGSAEHRQQQRQQRNRPGRRGGCGLYGVHRAGGSPAERGSSCSGTAGALPGTPGPPSCCAGVRRERTTPRHAAPPRHHPQCRGTRASASARERRQSPCADPRAQLAQVGLHPPPPAAHSPAALAQWQGMRPTRRHCPGCSKRMTTSSDEPAAAAAGRGWEAGCCSRRLMPPSHHHHCCCNRC